MRRLLRIPDGPAAPEGRPAGLLDVDHGVGGALHPHLHRAAVRGAVLGFAAGVGPIIGIPIGTVAIVQRADDPPVLGGRPPLALGYTALALTVISLLLVLMAKDLASVFG